MTEDAFRFDDGKAPGAMRTIGEVSAALGIRQHVLRYWEEQFPMLRPVKRSGGRRYYRPEDVRLLALIDRLVREDGYTLRGARTAIEAGATAPAPPVVAAAVGPDSAAEVTMLQQLTAIRATLVEALAQG